MRIVAGRWGGRRLTTPRGTAVRPTADRVREALFSILGAAVEGARVLDLFAGSGALGLEALSRGAAEATFVDSSAASVAAVRANLAAVALADDERGRRQHSWQRLRQLAPEALGRAIWRVEKDEIVVASLPRCGAEEPQGVRAAHFGLAADRLEVGPHRRHGGRRGVHERRLRGAARERLEPERARPREEVEHPRVLHAIAQDREQRLAHAVRRRARSVALRGGEAPAAPAAGDDPHFRRNVAVMPAWSDG